MPGRLVLAIASVMSDFPSMFRPSQPGGGSTESFPVLNFNAPVLRDGMSGRSCAGPKLDFCIFRGFAGCGVQADGGQAIRVIKSCAPQLNAVVRVAFWSRFFEHPRDETGPSKIRGPVVQKGRSRHKGGAESAKFELSTARHKRVPEFA